MSVAAVYRAGVVGWRVCTGTIKGPALLYSHRGTACLGAVHAEITVEHTMWKPSGGPAHSLRERQQMYTERQRKGERDSEGEKKKTHDHDRRQQRVYIYLFAYLYIYIPGRAVRTSKHPLFPYANALCRSSGRSWGSTLRTRCSRGGR